MYETLPRNTTMRTRKELGKGTVQIADSSYRQAAFAQIAAGKLQKLMGHN
jgi:hypothetical protein